MDEQEGEKEGVIEIPVGSWLAGVRKEPWILSTFALAIVLIVVLVIGTGNGGRDVGEILNADTVGNNVLAFINSNPQLEGQVSLVYSVRQGSLYQITLNYQGQDVPVFATLDGQFLVSDVVPIAGGIPTTGGSNSGTGNTAVVEVSADDDAFLGSADAPGEIIEFSDYQCPFCRIFWEETLPLIKEEYIDTGKVRFVYRDYPIDGIHPMATPAAIAAECVRSLGGDEAYFVYHDKLFANQAQLSVGNLKAWASDLGYDISTCLDSGEFADEVQQDLSDGSAAGVTGTPGFFINGVKIDGAQPFIVFKQIIDAQLGAA